MNFDSFILLVKKTLNLEFKAVKLKYLWKGKHRIISKPIDHEYLKKYLKK